MSTFSPQSIEPKVLGEQRNEDPIAHHSGASSKNWKHAMAYEWEKRCYDTLLTSRTMVYQFQPELITAGNNAITWHYGKRMLTLADCSHFRKTRGQRHEHGRNSRREMAQARHTPRSRPGNHYIREHYSRALLYVQLWVKWTLWQLSSRIPFRKEC